MNDQLPARQRAVLDAVRRSIQRRHKVPSILELAAELGVSGPTVHQHLRALERKGFLRREPGSPRNIELIDAPAEEPCQCTPVPLVGRVAAARARGQDGGAAPREPIHEADPGAGRPRPHPGQGRGPSPRAGLTSGGRR